MDGYYKKASISFLGGFFLIFLTTSIFGQNMFRKVNDFDGDGKADFAVTRNINGLKYWYIWQSTDGFRVSQWGIATDQNTSGDYDGDGKYDPAIFRKTVTPSNAVIGSFWVDGSQIGTLSVTINPPAIFANCYALTQDYNGDGKTDFALTISPSGNLMDVIFISGGVDRHISPNVTLDKIGDMTGDGKADLFAYNPNTFVATIQTYGTNTTQSIQFGTAGDKYVAADFDGDGKGDLTVFRESDGTWWWIKSSDNTINAVKFGTSGDVPVPADYDGDGKTDLAIWRSGPQSYYWVYGSQVGVFVLAWGISDDSVVRY